MRLLFNLKWKYFHQFWSFIEIGIIVCAWSSVGIYIYRFKESNRIEKLFQQTNGYRIVRKSHERFFGHLPSCYKR